MVMTRESANVPSSNQPTSFRRFCCYCIPELHFLGRVRLLLLLDFVKLTSLALYLYHMQVLANQIAGCTLNGLLFLFWAALLVRTLAPGDNRPWVWRYIRACHCVAPFEMGYFLVVEVSSDANDIPAWLKALQYAFPIADALMKAGEQLWSLRHHKAKEADQPGWLSEPSQEVNPSGHVDIEKLRDALEAWQSYKSSEEDVDLELGDSPEDFGSRLSGQSTRSGTRKSSKSSKRSRTFSDQSQGSLDSELGDAPRLGEAVEANDSASRGPGVSTCPDTRTSSKMPQVSTDPLVKDISSAAGDAQRPNADDDGKPQAFSAGRPVEDEITHKTTEIASQEHMVHTKTEFSSDIFNCDNVDANDTVSPEELLCNDQVVLSLSYVSSEDQPTVHDSRLTQFMGL